jgi:hypothetical protein
MLLLLMRELYELRVISLLFQVNVAMCTATKFM